MPDSIERAVAAVLGGMLESFTAAVASADTIRATLRDLGIEGPDADSLAGYLGAQAPVIAQLNTALPDLLSKLATNASLDTLLAPIVDLVESVTSLAAAAPPVALPDRPDLPDVGNVLDFLLSRALDESIQSLNPGLWAFLRSMNLVGPDIGVVATVEAFLSTPLTTAWERFKSQRRNLQITVTGLLTGPRTTSVLTTPAGNAGPLPDPVTNGVPAGSQVISQVVVALAADTYDDPVSITFDLLGDASSPPRFAALVARTEVSPPSLALGKHVSVGVEPPHQPLGLAITGFGELKSITGDPKVTLTSSLPQGKLGFGDPGGLHLTLAEPVLGAELGGAAWGATFGVGRFEITIPNGIAGPIIGLLLPSAGITLRGKLVAQVDEHGVHLDGGVGLVTTWPDTLRLPGVVVRDLKTDISVGATISVAAYGTVVVTLGPVTAAIQGLGITQPLQVRGDAGGNLGLLDLPAPALHPPTGFGVSVDAAALKGSGFLQSEGDEISGALELALSLGPVQLSVRAIAVFDNVDGAVSFLIVIGVEFSPAIELFLGLTLNGVGGVFGLNRTLDADALGALVRSGRMEDIMFPHDLAARAPEIIGSAKQTYPARRGQYVVGPMLKLGWGRPKSFVSVSVGVVFTFPDPVVVAIIGTMHLGLPDDALPVIELNCGFAGGADFTTGNVWFDASLERSHIGMFDVSGDLCLRAGSAGFVFSAGGFHPKFTPPANVPALRRLAISLAPYPILKIRAEAYFALTASTVQFGGRVFVVAELGPIGADGDIGLDVLIQTEPRFHFTAEMSGHFHLTVFDEDVCGASVDVLLEGPGRWHARAHATIELLFISVSGTIDVGWGEDALEERPPVDPAEVVHRALSEDHVWAHVVPAADAGVVHIRPGATGLHPLGSLRLTQTALPLGIRLDRYAANPVTSHGPVTVSVTAAGAGAPKAAQELFATAQYLDRTDDERLSKPAFEPFDAGYVVAGDAWSVAETPVTVEIEYEESTGDDPPGPRDRITSTIADAMLGWSITSAAGRNRLDAVNPAPVRKVGVSEPTYVVADAATGGLLVSAPGDALRTSMAVSADRVSMATYERAVMA